MAAAIRVKLPSGLLIEVLVDEDETETVGVFKDRLHELLGAGVNFRLIGEGRVLRDSELIVPSAQDKVLFVALDSSSGSQSPGPMMTSGLQSLSLDPAAAATSVPSPDPAFSNLVGSMLGNNPELLKSMLMSHPQMKSLLERSPQLREALNNPQVLQDMLRLATNPQYYQEAMRGADRAMSQLENIPQGFQMLRQLHEQIDESDAGPGAGRGAVRVKESSPAAVLQSKPLPNPWAAKAATPTAMSRPSSAPPDYSTQLEELRNLGFRNSLRNLDMLKRTKGNVNSAVELLIMSGLEDGASHGSSSSGDDGTEDVAENGSDNVSQ